MSEPYTPRPEPASSLVDGPAPEYAAVTGAPQWPAIQTYLEHLARTDRAALERVREVDEQLWIRGDWVCGPCGCLIGHAADEETRSKLIRALPGPHPDCLNEIELAASDAYEIMDCEDLSDLVAAIQSEAARLLTEGNPTDGS